MKWWAFFGVAAIMLVLFGIGYSRTRVSSNAQQTFEVSRTRAEIADFFGSVGSKEAYTDFKKSFASAPQSDQHQAAHLFGEMLYERDGLNGFSICDSSFGFGCFHSFIGLAIAEHGYEVVQDLDKACIQNYGEGGLGCFHGIGHGLLAYRGYSSSSLLKALSVCATLSWRHTFGGCQDGVFMEYNFHTMEIDLSKRGRPFTAAEQYMPCTSVSARFQADCYFNLPSWWETQLHAPVGEGEKLSALCSEIMNVKNREACFRGIGFAYLPSVSFRAESASALCDELPAPEKERLLCREGLAWGLYAEPTTRSEVSTACEKGLSESEAEECNRHYLFYIQ